MLGDLFLSTDDVEPPQHRERVAALLQRGYDIVASVHTAAGRITQADKCSVLKLDGAALASASADARRALAVRSGAVVSTIAAPPGVSLSGGRDPGSRGSPCHLAQLSRLHLVATDAVQASQLSSSDEVVRSYDLVSITPKSEKVLHQACTSLEVDLISLELSQRMTLKLRGPTIKAALRRGIYFEICYAPGLREPTARRNLFCNAQALVRATRGQNILISSSARSAFEVRSPLEVAHMATLFGLTHKQAQEAVSLAPRAVLARAAARRAGRGAAVAVPAVAATAALGAAAVDAVDVRMEDAEAQDSGRGPAQQQQQQQQAPAAGGPAAGGAGGGRGARKRTAAGVR